MQAFSLRRKLERRHPVLVERLKALRALDPRLLGHTKADVERIHEFLKNGGGIGDLQGLVENATGRFFVFDPSEVDTSGFGNKTNAGIGHILTGCFGGVSSSVGPSSSISGSGNGSRKKVEPRVVLALPPVVKSTPLPEPTETSGKVFDLPKEKTAPTGTGVKGLSSLFSKTKAPEENVRDVQGSRPFPFRKNLGSKPPTEGEEPPKGPPPKPRPWANAFDLGYVSEGFGTVGPKVFEAERIKLWETEKALREPEKEVKLRWSIGPVLEANVDQARRMAVTALENFRARLGAIEAKKKEMSDGGSRFLAVSRRLLLYRLYASSQTATRPGDLGTPGRQAIDRAFDHALVAGPVAHTQCYLSINRAMAIDDPATGARKDQFGNLRTRRSPCPPSAPSSPERRPCPPGTCRRT